MHDGGERVARDDRQHRVDGRQRVLRLFEHAAGCGDNVSISRARSSAEARAGLEEIHQHEPDYDRAADTATVKTAVRRPTRRARSRRRFRTPSASDESTSGKDGEKRVEDLADRPGDVRTTYSSHGALPDVARATTPSTAPSTSAIRMRRARDDRTQCWSSRPPLSDRPSIPSRRVRTA